MSMVITEVFSQLGFQIVSKKGYGPLMLKTHLRKYLLLKNQQRGIYRVFQKDLE